MKKSLRVQTQGLTDAMFLLMAHDEIQSASCVGTESYLVGQTCKTLGKVFHVRSDGGVSGQFRQATLQGWI